MKERLSGNNSSLSATHMEQGISNALSGEEGIKRLDGRVSISIHSKRNRLTDSDGACSKYVIDALVTNGLLQNDSPQYIPESPRKTQEKLAGQEYTIITIEEVTKI